MATNLPSEILLNIVEESGKSPRPDFQVLRALASTCCSLRPEALKHIYRDVRLLVDARFSSSYCGVYDVKWQSMAMIIAANPSIATYVKEAMFLLRRAGDIPPGLLQLLDQFKNLYKIECGHSLHERFIHNQQRVEWSRLSESTRQGWRTVFQIPTHLLLKNLRGIPVSELQPCKRMTRLSFDLDSSVEAPDDFAPSRSIALKDLTFEAPFEAVMCILLIIDPAEVTTLNFEGVDVPWTDLDCQWLRAFPKLTRLHVNLRLSISSFFHHVAPGVVQRLESFTMRVRLDDAMKNGVWPGYLISASAHPGFLALKALFLVIHLESIGLDEFNLPEFLHLDRYISSPYCFPVLQTLEVTLLIGPNWGSISAMRDWTSEDTIHHMPLSFARLGQCFQAKMRFVQARSSSPLPLE